MKLQSWGNYPLIDHKTTLLSDEASLGEFMKSDARFIAYGNGRSYGDSALAEHLLYTKGYDYFLDFDEDSGVLECTSGVTLEQILDLVVPKGWFLAITPGTKLITVGGAIASDVHGKNHHIEGCFSECVESMRVMLASSKVVEVSKDDELFLATCGGMGLTGVILSAKMRLKKIDSSTIDQTTIKTKNLKETFEAFESYKGYSYSVAWIDALASGDELGRSLLMVGEFAKSGGLEYKSKTKLSVPFYLPSFTLNSLSVRAFNYLYYTKAKNGISYSKVSIDSFFYPLDAIANWNKIYGKNGFTQYQIIVPKEQSYEALSKILSLIAKSGKGSFLAVLKLYGKANANYLSFPLEGYSLALDFKIEDDLFALLDELDKVVLEYGGRVYLTKDVRVERESFDAGYERADLFRSFREANGMREKFNSLQSKRLGL